MANKGYTEASALNVVTSAGAMVKEGKLIVVEDGLNGLRSCGAMDFLTKHCGFNVAYKVKEKK